MGMGVEFKHPADEIAQALARANGILTVISGCYEKSAGEFAIGTTYLAESISAVDGLLNAATLALARLYQTCDLNIVRDLPGAEPEDAEPSETAPILVSEGPVAVSAVKAASSSVFVRTSYQQKPAKVGYLAAFGPSETAISLVERAETAVPSFAPPVAIRREAVLEKPATTYDELLAKVTAVADQAAFQAHASPSDRSLLPALEGLRADLLKMRAVA